ncbi:MAG: hypothetical protein D6785_09635 [Planctomycetota bacterium]|nr:MAG: hypothetical protein D6785_09635 [Planctomycetota bacterium]
MKNKSFFSVNLFFLFFLLFCVYPSFLGAEKIYSTMGRYYERILQTIEKNQKLYLLLGDSSHLPLTGVVKINYRYRKRNPLFMGDRTIIALATGDILKGNLVKGGSLDIHFEVKGFSTMKISLDYLRAVFFLQSLKTPKAREDYFRKVMEEKKKKDILYLKKGGKIRCVIEGIYPQYIRYQLQGLGSRKIEVNKLLAVKIAPLGGEFQKPKTHYGQFILDQGEILQGQILGLNSGSWQIKTFLGSKIALHTSRILEIYFYGGQFDYLSDLKPIQFKYTPGIANLGSPPFTWKKDQNIFGHPLRLGGRIYPKGIGLHTKMVLTYSIDGKYTFFYGKLGFDDSVWEVKSSYQPKGRFRIFGDGKLLYDSKVFQTKKALDIQVSLVGVKTLTIDAGFPENQDDILGRLNLVDAYLVKK